MILLCLNTSCFEAIANKNRVHGELNDSDGFGSSWKLIYNYSREQKRVGIVIGKRESNSKEMYQILILRRTELVPSRGKRKLWSAISQRVIWKWSDPARRESFAWSILEKEKSKNENVQRAGSRLVANDKTKRTRLKRQKKSLFSNKSRTLARSISTLGMIEENTSIQGENRAERDAMKSQSLATSRSW